VARNQRDEPTHALIADSTDTSASDQKAAPNACIDALQQAGIVGYS
jgi:hypothetical protein